MEETWVAISRENLHTVGDGSRNHWSLSEKKKVWNPIAKVDAAETMQDMRGADLTWRHRGEWK